LEFVVDPDAKSIKEAPGAGDDRTGFEWGLLNLHKKVEVRPEVSALCSVRHQEETLTFGEHFLVAFEPSGEFVFNASLVIGYSIGSEIFVGIPVLKVIVKGEPEVGIAFDDRRP
jgi:hypothetical protein